MPFWLRPSALAALAAGALLGLALWALRPAPAPQEAPAHADFSDREGGAEASASEVAATPARLALRHRLADVGWRLIETERGVDRRLDQPAALIGGAPVETPAWYVLVHAVWPISEETRRQYPGRDFSGSEERGQCGGKLYRLGDLSFIETAAHCLLARDGAAPRRVEVCLQPFSRSACRARYVAHSFAVDAGYEEDWAAGLREDRALIFLPEDPGGGAALPQTPRVQMEVGERIRVFAMGSDAAGDLSERLKSCEQVVTEVRPGLVTTRATPDCAVRGADSGSPAGRMVGGDFVQTLIVSSYDARDPSRNSYAPIRPEKVRAAAGAWAE